MFIRVGLVASHAKSFKASSKSCLALASGDNASVVGATSGATVGAAGALIWGINLANKAFCSSALMLGAIGFLASRMLLSNWLPLGNRFNLPFAFCSIKSFAFKRSNASLEVICKFGTSLFIA